MQTTERITDPQKRRAARLERAREADVFWPTTLELRYGISRPTRWRWEKDGKLPPRDVKIAGKSGWRRSTIEAAEQSAA